MNGRERFLTALRRQQPDRVPIWELIVNEPTRSAWGATSLEDFVEAEDLDGITVFEDTPLTPLTADSVGVEGVGEAQADHWQIVWRQTDVAIPYPESGPIGSPEDLARYRPPDPDDDARLASLRSAVDRFQGERAIVFLTHDAFEFSHYLLGGMDRLLMAYIEAPDFVHDLAQLVMDYKIRLMKKAIGLGADAIVSGDDYAATHGPAMSPDHFRQFVLPYLTRSVEVAHEAGVPFIKHTDGNIWPLLDMMVDEAKIDAIDPLEPLAGMDAGKVKAAYGDRIAVIGNIDCTELLCHGSVAEVEAAVQETIAKAAPGGGYVLASSNSIHPAVTPTNYRAMVEAGRRWGRYPLDEKMVTQFRERDYAARWRP
jgi:uroporphyrinogen decarboxylase